VQLVELSGELTLAGSGEKGKKRVQIQARQRERTRQDTRCLAELPAERTTEKKLELVVLSPKTGPAHRSKLILLGTRNIGLRAETVRWWTPGGQIINQNRRGVGNRLPNAKGGAAGVNAKEVGGEGEVKGCGKRRRKKAYSRISRGAITG